jgi:8-oxo-dGTP pyrophosphatase MutT (NUDIX family)
VADQQTAPASADDPSAVAPVAASSIPSVLGALGPAIAAVEARLLLGAALRRAIEAIIGAFEGIARQRYEGGTQFTLDELRRQFPDRRDIELRRLVAQERKFEMEYRRKMRERLMRDVPAALKNAEPGDRLEALRKIFDREKRYAVAREEAMFLRALGKAEALSIREASPKGAYWQLSPFVKEHTLDCLALGEQFWPWELLETIQPPLHHGCACYLLGLDEAVERGLMTPDQIPDPSDAVARARQALKDAEAMEEALPADTIRAYIDGLASSENVVAIDEAKLLPGRKATRWQKGYRKGGQFRPERGGDPGARALRALFPKPKSPAALRGERRGRWSWINGVYTRVPHADHWEREVAGKQYLSPAGSTNVYRDGKLFDGLGLQSDERWPREGSKRAPSGDLASRIEAARTKLRAKATREPSPAHAPLEKGDGPSALLALPDQGFQLVKASPGSGGTHLTFRSPAASLEAVFDGRKVAYVSWDPAPAPPPDGHELGRAPKDWEEHRRDAFAWASELGERFDSQIVLTSLSTDSSLSDHAGTHLFDGSTLVGPDTERDIERAGSAREAGRELTDDEKRGVWSSYWVTAHEVAGHSVNPIEPWLWAIGPHANLEEALTEEMAHVLAVERLTEQGQDDVLAWRAANPDATAVRGVYRRERAALGGLLDDLGLTDPFDRRAIIEDLKFRVPPVERLDGLAGMLVEAGAAKDHDAALERVERVLSDPPDGDGAALAPFVKSPGLAQVGAMGYGRFTGAKLSKDGMTLTLPDGGVRRVENLPIMAPELEGLTDGTALAVYPRHQPVTRTLYYADGSPKNFRYVDSPERAQMILRAFVGKGSPGSDYAGDFGLREIFEPGDTPESLAGKLEGLKTWATVQGVPIKRRFGGSFGVGFPGFDGRRLSDLGSAQSAAETALKRASDGVGPLGRPAAPASPGTDGLWDWFKGLTHSGQGELDADEQEALDKAFQETLDKKPSKAPKAPKDPLVGRKIGGLEGAASPKGEIPSYDSQELTLGKSAGGSNGARWAFDDGGDRWLLKTYRGDRDRIATELLANAVYRELGAKAARAGTITVPPSGKPDFRKLPDVDVGEPELPKLEKGRRMSTGIIVAEPDGRLWVYEPKGHFGGYEHTFPKGGLEHGLTAQQNAHKELWEETGLHASITGFLGDYEGDTGTSRYYLAVRTGGEPLPDDPTPHKKGSGAETAAVKLVSPAEAADMLNRGRDKKILADAVAAGLPKGDPPADNFPEPQPTMGLTYKALDGEIRTKFKPSEALGEHYMADALLANWDFVGMTGDNVLWDGDTPIRLDQGGTFEFRAQGTPKPYGPVPTEVWTMLSKGQGKRGVIVNEEQMREQAGAIAATMTPARVDDLIDQTPFGDEGMRERVRENLKARIGWMADFHAGKVDLPRPFEGEEAHDALFDSLEPGMKDVRPEEEDALFAYVEGMDEEINAALKKGGQRSKPVQKAVEALDTMIRYSKTGEDVIAYVPISLKPGKKGFDGLVDQTVEEKGYLHLDVDRPATPAVVRVVVPAGSLALYTPLWEDMLEGSPELLAARGSRLKITAQRRDGDQIILEATLATKASYAPAPKYVPPAKPSGGGQGVMKDYTAKAKGEAPVGEWQDLGKGFWKRGNDRIEREGKHGPFNVYRNGKFVKSASSLEAAMAELA